jgi:hypothetical protein
MAISSEMQTQILELYTAYFNRAADRDGVDYWLGEIENNNWSVEQVAQSFADSSEYRSIYDGLSNEQVIDKIYNNLLNRSPDDAGLEYWVGELDSGNISVNAALLAIVNAATETENGVAKNPEDKAVVDNKSAVSQYTYDYNVNDNSISLATITSDSSSVDVITDSIELVCQNINPITGECEDYSANSMVAEVTISGVSAYDCQDFLVM